MIRYRLQQVEEEWGDEKIVPVKEVAHALDVGERRVVREAKRRHVEVPLLLTKAPHLTKSGARFLRWVPADFALEMAKETNANASDNSSSLSTPLRLCFLPASSQTKP